MKVISIKQPWASLIMFGYKNYEFRSWKTNYRGRLLIHASKNVDKQAMQRFEKLNLKYPLGVIMGEVELTDCVKMTNDLANILYLKDNVVYKNVLDYDKYGWKIINVKRYDQYIPINGKLGLWEFEEK